MDQLVGLVKSYFIAGKLDSMLIHPLYDPYVRACACLKHQAFHEEREVRIIASPNSKGFLEALHAEQPDVALPSVAVKEVLYRGEYLDVPYIRLFDFPDKQPLPIRRIIVGPHHNQDRLLSMVKKMCAGRYPVIASATPFLKTR